MQVDLAGKIDVQVDPDAEPTDHGAAIARFLLAYVRSQPDSADPASSVDGPQLFEARSSEVGQQ